MPFHRFHKEKALLLHFLINFQDAFSKTILLLLLGNKIAVNSLHAKTNTQKLFPCFQGMSNHLKMIGKNPFSSAKQESITKRQSLFLHHTVYTDNAHRNSTGFLHSFGIEFVENSIVLIGIFRLSKARGGNYSDNLHFLLLFQSASSYTIFS